MICYVEDDDNIRELVTYTLEQSGFEAKGFPDADSFYEYLLKQTPELVLLDIMLPAEDGLAILKRLRGDPHTSTVPVMMVTAKSSEYDKVVGLDLGADDYIAKPFGMMELVARVRALIRRSSAGAGKPLAVGELSLDPEARTVVAGGEEVALTYKEFELLRLLMENAGRAFDRERLLETIWGYDYDGGTRTVDVHIQTLRQKLKDCGALIKTMRGVGYKLEDK